MKQSITQSEWEIMRVVWSNHHVTNNQIYDVLSEKMDWKMSTIKTLVRRLTEKGYLEAEKDSREFTYSPLISQNDAYKEAGEDMLNQICSKEVGSVLTQFIEDYEMSQSDLKKLEAVIQKKYQSAPESVACNCVPGQCNCKVLNV